MANTTRTKPAKAFFCIEIFAEEVHEKLSERKSALYRKLDDDPKTTPDMMDCWYDFSDRLRDVIVDGHDELSAATTEGQADKIAADITKRFNALVADYRKAEHKRAKDAPKLKVKQEAEREADEIMRLTEQMEAREAAIEQFPELAGRDDFMVLGGWVFTGKTDDELTPEEKADIERSNRLRNLEARLKAELAAAQEAAFWEMICTTHEDCTNPDDDGRLRTEAEMAEAEIAFWAKVARDGEDAYSGCMKGELDFWTKRRKAKGNGHDTSAKVHDDRFDIPEWERMSTDHTIGDLSDPVDLWAQFDPPEMPRGLLPKLIEDYAFALANVMGCDPAGLATGALAVCAGAIPDQIMLKMKKHSDLWMESTRIWLAQIGDPSTKKSPMRNVVLGVLRKMEAEEAAKFAAAMSMYLSLDKEAQKNADKPTCVRYMIDNTTLEAAQDALRHNKQGILVCPDEMSGWIAAMDKYNGGKGGSADRGPWLSSFNGGPMPVDRVSRGAFLIPNWSANLFGGIQPDVVRKIAADSYDDGFLQRMFLIVLREAAVGKDVPIPDIAEQYDALVRRLATLSPRSIKWNLDPDRGVLKFDDKAQELRNELEIKHHELLKLKTINKKLAGHIGKYDGFFGKLCLLWHCIEHAHEKDLPGTIKVETAQRVADFMDSFLLPHALAFFAGMLGLSDNHDELTNVAGYILAHKKSKMSHRDTQRAGRAMAKLDHWASTKLYEQMETLGWLTRATDSRSRPANYWNVNPKVHALFADRASRERGDREMARTLIIAKAAAKKKDDQG